MVYLRRLLFWLLPVAWGILILVLSLMPGGPGNMILFGIPHFDKVGHFGMYAIWTFLIARSLIADSAWPGGRAFWLAILVGTLAGIGLEYGQYFMHQGRSFEAADMVANASGAITGAWACLKVLGRREKGY